MKAAPLLLVVCACTGASVPFEISMVLERDGQSERCPTNSCDAIGLGCDAAMMIRVVDANDDQLVYLYRCLRVPGGAGTSLCALGDVGDQLGDAAIPNTMVKIQIAVWPLSAADPLVCPNVTFSQDGLPNQIAPAPALGGQSYFRVGSAASASVTLGCIDVPSALEDPRCTQAMGVQVTSHVDDFNTLLTVTPFQSSQLTLSVGEPALDAPSGQYVLSNTTTMTQPILEPTPTWAATAPGFQDTACVQVAEHATFTTTLTCTEAMQPPTLALDGFLLSQQTLSAIQTAIGPLPASGLVVGKVVDSSGEPVAGATVSADQGTIVYLSDDLMSTTDAGGQPLTHTGMLGAFVSLDAPYLTSAAAPNTWHAMSGALHSTGTVIGGKVSGNVSVVLLQLSPP